MALSPSHGTPCSLSPEWNSRLSNDDAAAAPTMTTWNDDDGDDGDDRPIRTAFACGDNRIRMNFYLTWILLWLVMGQIFLPYKIKDNCKNTILSKRFMEHVDP